MRETLRLFIAMLKDRRGVTALEYAVVAAGIIAVAATAFTALGDRMGNVIDTIISGY